MLLTEEERDKFATYLEMTAASGKGIIKEMEKLGSIHEVMVKKIKAETMAELIVASKLRSLSSL